METLKYALRLVGVSLLIVVSAHLYGSYQQRSVRYGTDHPTLPMKAQIAQCDWRVWFEYGDDGSYAEALDEFTELTGIPWVEVEHDWEATVMVGIIEGQSTTLLGTAMRSPDLKWRTRIHINEWGLISKYDRSRVMLHEVLHIFGLYHSPQEESLMHEWYGDDKYLTDKDIANIKLLATTCPL